MGKYGTNLEGFGAFEGGVNADKGAPLVSTSSDGETALLFGPAALREIQAGVANGDFAIPPDAAGDTITAENPLPYWTFTDTSSSGNITCAVVADSGSGSGNTLVWTVKANTSSGSAKLTRYIPIAATQDRAFAYMFEVTAEAEAATNRTLTVTSQFLKQDFTSAGASYTQASKTFTEIGAAPVTLSYASSLNEKLMTPADAAYILIEITVAATASNAAAKTLTIYEIRMPVGQPMLLVGERTQAATYGPAGIWKTEGALNIGVNTPDTWTAGVLSTTEPSIKISETITTVTTGGFRANGGIAAIAAPDTTSGSALQVGLSTDTQARLLVKGDGSLNFGPGSSTAQDTNLYRSAADTLKTDDRLIIGGANSNWLSRITASAAQSLTNNTLTKITFNTASSTPTTDSYDPQGWFDNTNDRITVGQDGFYNITANIGFATNATGRRLVQIFVNGSDRGSVQVTASTAGSTLISVSTNIYLVATDYVEVHALQQSGGALNTANTTGVYPVLSVARVGA